MTDVFLSGPKVPPESLLARLNREGRSELELVMASFLANCASKETGKAYGAAVREFFALVSPHIGTLGELKRHHVIFYMDWLKEKGLANKSIQLKLAAVSSLCRFLAREGYVAIDLTYGIKRPRNVHRKETAALTEAEVRHLFENLPRTSCFLAHRAMLAIGFYTGLRSSEIRHLKIGSFCEVDGHRILKTTIKGDKPHEVPLNPVVVRFLGEHLAHLKTLGLECALGDYLFPRMRPKPINAPISRTALLKIFKNKLNRAGIKQSIARRYSPHVMRATLATHLLNTADVALEDVQKLLGHANPATTQAYNKRDKSHDKSPVYKIDY